MKNDIEPKIAGLEALVKSASERGDAPVEKWDPPHCGDIGLSIAKDGVWLYRGSPIGRKSLVKLFARILRREPDGAHVLVTPAEKVSVAVEDAPFLAVEMEVTEPGTESQQITLRTNVDDIVACSRDRPLSFRTTPDGGFKPYVSVRGGLEAVFTRPLAFDLTQLIETADSGAAGIRSGGTWFAIDS